MDTTLPPTLMANNSALPSQTLDLFTDLTFSKDRQLLSGKAQLTGGYCDRSSMSFLRGRRLNFNCRDRHKERKKERKIEIFEIIF